MRVVEVIFIHHLQMCKIVSPLLYFHLAHGHKKLQNNFRQTLPNLKSILVLDVCRFYLTNWVVPLSDQKLKIVGVG